MLVPIESPIKADQYQILFNLQERNIPKSSES
jgi:hypothetical protein